MTLMTEMSEEYRRAAVLVRMQLDEVREQLSKSPHDILLRGRARQLKDILQELRDVRDVTAHYYTDSRPEAYTTAGLRASRRS